MKLFAQDYLGAVAARYCEYGQAKTSNVVLKEQSLQTTKPGSRLSFPHRFLLFDYAFAHSV